MGLKDIIAGTYGGLGNVAGVPVNAEAFRDYLDYRKDVPKDSYKNNLKKKIARIVATGALLGVLSGCPNPNDPRPKNDNGHEQPAPIEIVVNGLSGIVNDNYVDVRPDGQPISGVDINVSNGSIADVYWEQGSTIGNIDYVGDSLNFTTLPNTGYFDVLIDAVNNGDIETKRVSGLLAGPERAYFIGNESQFNSEYGSLDAALQSGVIGGAVGVEYTQNDINNMFDGLPFIDYVKDSSEFRVGKDSNGDAYVITQLPDVFKVFEITSTEYNNIDANDLYGGF